MVKYFICPKCHKRFDEEAGTLGCDMKRYCDGCWLKYDL
jgi:hypothetical protein